MQYVHVLFTSQLYQALHPAANLRVYFLQYANSVEEQQYLTSLRQEKRAFETLIKDKPVSYFKMYLYT